MTATILQTGLKTSPASRWIRRETAKAPAAKKLHQYIDYLENACALYPESADLQTCLGMAHAQNEAVYPAKAAYEAALALDPRHFFARLRYAELCCRVGAWPRAELEAGHALRLARNGWESAMVRRLVEEISTESGSRRAVWRLPTYADRSGYSSPSSPPQQ